jgi:putative flippase GtrA
LSFFLNRHFTFQSREWSLFQAGAFILSIAVSYLLAYGISRPLVYRLAGSAHSRKFQENISLLAGMILFTVLNYFAQRMIVFRRKHER